MATPIIIGVFVLIVIACTIAGKIDKKRYRSNPRDLKIRIWSTPYRVRKAGHVCDCPNCIAQFEVVYGWNVRASFVAGTKEIKYDTRDWWLTHPYNAKYRQSYKDAKKIAKELEHPNSWAWKMMDRF